MNEKRPNFIIGEQAIKNKILNDNNSQKLPIINKNKKKKNQFKNLLLWSLLFHLIIILLILFFAFKKSKILIPFKMPAKKTPLSKNELPASLKPRKSAFGTTVIFDELPQFKKPKAEIMADQKQPELPSESTQIPTKKIAAKKTEETIEKKADVKKVERKIEKKLDEKIIIQAKKEKERTEIKEKKSHVAELKKDEQKTKDEVEKRIKEIEKKQELIAKAPQIQKMQKIRTIGDSQKDKSPITERKSIIAMTKGYIENLKAKGDDWLERKGDDNKRPSLEELKYISYEEKINWQLQSAWKQNFEFNPTMKMVTGKAVVDFKINADGSLNTLSLLQTSGNDQLDKIILKSIEFASPFPPLPKHFNKNVYSTGRIIFVSPRRLGL